MQNVVLLYFEGVLSLYLHIDWYIYSLATFEALLNICDVQWAVQF